MFAVNGKRFDKYLIKHLLLDAFARVGGGCFSFVAEGQVMKKP